MNYEASAFRALVFFEMVVRMASNSFVSWRSAAILRRKPCRYPRAVRANTRFVEFLEGSGKGKVDGEKLTAFAWLPPSSDFCETSRRGEARRAVNKAVNKSVNKFGSEFYG